MKVKTHLIIKDIHEEYKINWCGHMKDVKPMFQNGKLMFAIVGGVGRMELNTNSMKDVEECGKRMTYPKGREAITTDKAFIYLIEEDWNEKLMCVITHNRVKKFAPMYDEIRYY